MGFHVGSHFVFVGWCRTDSACSWFLVWVFAFCSYSFRMVSPGCLYSFPFGFDKVLISLSIVCCVVGVWFAHGVHLVFGGFLDVDAWFCFGFDMVVMISMWLPHGFCMFSFRGFVCSHLVHVCVSYGVLLNFIHFCMASIQIQSNAKQNKTTPYTTIRYITSIHIQRSISVHIYIYIYIDRFFKLICTHMQVYKYCIV